MNLTSLCSQRPALPLSTCCEQLRGLVSQRGTRSTPPPRCTSASRRVRASRVRPRRTCCVQLHSSSHRSVVRPMQTASCACSGCSRSAEFLSRTLLCCYRSRAWARVTTRFVCSVKRSRSAQWTPRPSRSWLRLPRSTACTSSLLVRPISCSGAVSRRTAVPTHTTLRRSHERVSPRRRWTRLSWRPVSEDQPLSCSRPTTLRHGTTLLPPLPSLFRALRSGLQRSRTWPGSRVPGA